MEYQKMNKVINPMKVINHQNHKKWIMFHKIKEKEFNHLKK